MTYVLSIFGLLLALWSGELFATASRMQARLESRTRALSCVALRTLQLKRSLAMVAHTATEIANLRAQFAQTGDPELRIRLDALLSQARIHWEGARMTIPSSCKNLQENWNPWRDPPADLLGPLPPELPQQLHKICESDPTERRCGQVSPNGFAVWAAWGEAR